nr:hypothetical protein [Tanacetum cinerariifolium]
SKTKKVAELACGSDDAKQPKRVSQNGASVASIKIGISSCHGSVCLSVQGSESVGPSKSVQGSECDGPYQSQIGATHSQNGNGYQAWGSYIGSPTVATPTLPKWSPSFIRSEILRGEVSGS